MIRFVIAAVIAVAVGVVLNMLHVFGTGPLWAAVVVSALAATVLLAVDMTQRPVVVFLIVIFAVGAWLTPHDITAGPLGSVSQLVLYVASGLVAMLVVSYVSPTPKKKVARRSPMNMAGNG